VVKTARLLIRRTKVLKFSDNQRKFTKNMPKTGILIKKLDPKI